MKSRPILFSEPMVIALLDGRKTQTRRIVKPRNPKEYACLVDRTDMLLSIGAEHTYQDGSQDEQEEAAIAAVCPYGQIEDQLWVRETWRSSTNYDHLAPSKIPDVGMIEYTASTSGRLCGKLRPSIFMMRWMSRITLEITNVRVERLNDISEEDAMAEGIDLSEFARQAAVRYAEINGITNPRPAAATYKTLWESINGPGSWDQNPYVWAITFNIIKP